MLHGQSLPHGGDARGLLTTLLARSNGWRAAPAAVTGRKFRDLVNLPAISEPEAVELAAAHLLGDQNADLTVLCAGGETFMAYRLDAKGLVREVLSGNKCASGTGEFFLQQLGRMGLGLADLAGMDPEADPYKVSGRCSVFCKSDCTHALNKGAPRQEVAAGLGRMMAGKCLEILGERAKGRVLLTGGCAANPYLVRFLRREVGELIVPEEAPWFEALGAALWAAAHARPFGPAEVFRTGGQSFARLAPLRDALHLVEFKEHPRDTARPGDRVLCGLDVGSTTTKGVIMRLGDRAILAGEYLRTDGDPIGASRKVYASLAAQLRAPVEVVGLGVTGSGRAIAALHAGATAAINEIIAHAAAAVHFDPQVDTIFEIGGQDAKYTFLFAGNPCDSAMNEACSAGTGSFLEESAKESLGVATTDIADLALGASYTPNFNDQCAAFIGSDIKLAVQEGVPTPEILAGLVHSVCVNYVRRVKGSRQVGERVFMQGGVCYNRAVPAAMAALTGKTVVVPPEPGLMGALGVAIEVERRMLQGHLPEGRFDLAALAELPARYKKPFTCRGGRGGQAGCDRGCTIARIEVGGKVHPFGGACNRFENLRQGRLADASRLDLAAARQRRVFAGFAPPAPGRPVVGLSRSYLVNTYFPLFSTFFTELGFAPLLADSAAAARPGEHGRALCYPAQISYGFLADLLEKQPLAVFLPHLTAQPLMPGQDHTCTCVLLQGEPFYLKAAFPELGENGQVLLNPTLNFSLGLSSAKGAFAAVGRALGADQSASARAFALAVEAQRACRNDLERMGRDALSLLADSPDLTGVVLFGRPYNAFAAEANKGVPEKLATRGALVIPCDMLPPPRKLLEPERNMYWGQGRVILEAARLTAAHENLYGTYVTNFSCGPDSFLLSYFRDEMGDKPSLTLELDSHTAGAGLETRIEAFLDIADIHRRQGTRRKPITPGQPFVPARLEERASTQGVRTSDGEWLPLTHPRVKLLMPSMNAYASRLAAAALSRGGLRGQALGPPALADLRRGQGVTTCKECLPLQLTVGSMLEYMDTRPPDEVSVYFMPSAKGPCRFGQYHVATRRLMEKFAIPDAAILAPCADNGYAGLGAQVTIGLWRAAVIGDLFEEIRSTLLAGAVNVPAALAVLDERFRLAVDRVAGPWRHLRATLEETARVLARLPLKAPYRDLPKVALVGEIYVRHDPLSRQRLVESLAERGFVVRTAPISEWVFYTDWILRTGRTGPYGLKDRLNQWVKRRIFRAVRKAMAPCGLFYSHAPATEELARAAESFISPELTGEALLTVGAAFHEMFAPALGVVAIGPFGCMPTRLAEAVLAERFTTEHLGRLYPDRTRGLPPEARGKLPLVCLETDGAPYTQLAEARLEAFRLQVARLHRILGSPA
ncbi:BadF/BadG/BcrA/BcrD ATPase family protein [Fundidesulfovibrio butyratiphilus]